MHPPPCSAPACGRWAGNGPSLQEKPALKERLEQALDPFSKAIPLSPSEVSRTRRWLIQAGYREPRHLTVYVGSRLATAIFGLALVIACSGFNSPAA